VTLQTDFWAGSGRIGSDVRIMVSPGYLEDVTNQLRNSGMKVRMRTRNVQKSVTFLHSMLTVDDVVLLT